MPEIESTDSDWPDGLLDQVLSLLSPVELSDIQRAATHRGVSVEWFIKHAAITQAVRDVLKTQ